MMSEEKCQECNYSNDFKGCALKHVTTARKLMAEGKLDGADHQLSCLEQHLKKME